MEIDAEIDEVQRLEDVDGLKHASCLNSYSSTTLYMIRALNYSASSGISCHFCFTHAFSSVEIDAEIDEVQKSEDVDGIKNTFCLNFCSSTKLYMIRTSEYSASSEANCHFCSTDSFSSVEIDVKLDVVH
jgi:hypothetical protein